MEVAASSSSYYCQVVRTVVCGCGMPGVRSVWLHSSCMWGSRAKELWGMWWQVTRGGQKGGGAIS